MRIRIKHVTALLACILFAGASSALAQQKGQWVLGQFGLNAGVIPDPGITYANLALNYSAGQLNNSSGNSIPGITGNYSFWVDENIIYYARATNSYGEYSALARPEGRTIVFGFSWTWRMPKPAPPAPQAAKP